jgi:hypothetical protein
VDNLTENRENGMKKLILILLVTLGLLSGIVSATTATTATPSPAPSKTQQPSTTPTSQATQEVTRVASQLTPFTQTDLQVITGNVQRPNGMVWFDGKLYVVCNGDWTVYEIDATTGSTVTYIYGVRNGHALYPEHNVNNQLTLWVPDFDLNTLLEVNPVRAPSPIARSLASPWGIAPLDQQHFLVTNLRSNDIVQISRQGRMTHVLGELRSPTGIATDQNYVYFANSGSARRAMEWFDKSLFDVAEGEALPAIEPQPLVSGLQSVTGVVKAIDGYLYFAYSLGTRGVVGRVNPQVCIENGGCSNNEVEIVLFTDLAAPLAGLTISTDMKLFIHTMFRPEIYWVQLPLPQSQPQSNLTPTAAGES